MIFSEWQHVLVKWVNCLDLRDTTINCVGELSLDTFFQEISTQLKPTVTGKINDCITTFLHNEFSDFDFNHKSVIARKCNETEATYILSILLFHCFIKEDDLRAVMCQRLDPSCQELLKEFIAHLYDKTITRNNIKTAIDSIKTNRTDSLASQPHRPYRLSVPGTPKRSPLNAPLTTPMFQQQKLLEERSRQLKNTKLELEFELSEKIDLTEQLNIEKNKNKNLNAKLAEKCSIINKLQEDWLSSQKGALSPNKKKGDIEKIQCKEIKSLEAYILKLETEIEPVREKLDSYKRKLARADESSKTLQQKLKDTDLVLERVSLELEVKTHELEGLRELCAEQEGHLRGLRNEFNLSIESDESPLERLFSPERVVECVPLSLTVVDLQLKEKEAENAELSQRIQDQAANSASLQSKLKESEERLAAALSDMDLLSRGKLAVEEQLVDSQSVLRLRDSDVTKCRYEIQSLSSDCSSLRDKLGEVEHELKVKTDLVAELELEVNENQRKIEESLEQANDADIKNTKLESSLQTITLCIQKKLAHLETILATLSPSAVVSHKECVSPNVESYTSMSKIDTTTGMLTILVDKLDVESKHSVQEFSKLTQSCNELNGKLLHYQDSTASLEAKVGALLLENGILAEQLTRAEEARFNSGQRIEQLSKEIDERASLAAVLQQNIVNLDSSRAELEEELNAIKEQLQTTSSDLEGARLDKNNLLELHNQMKRDFEEGRCSLIAHANELQTRLACEAEALISLQGNFEEIKQQYATTVNDLDRLSRDYSLLKEVVNSKTDLVAKLELEVNEKQRKIEEGLEQANEAENENAKLESSLQNITLCIQKNLAHLETILATLSPSAVVSREECVSPNVESYTSMSEIDTSTGMLTILVDKLDVESKHSVQEFSKLTESCNVLNGRLLHYQDSTASLEANARALSLEKDALAEQLTLGTLRLCELESSLSDLKAEKENINADLKVSEMLNKEMECAMLEGERKMTDVKTKFELRLKTCEIERESTLKSLQEELAENRQSITVLAENFTREIQEKDVAVEAASEKNNASRREIDRLVSEGERTNDELQNLRFVLSETMGSLDEALAEKTTMVEHAAEAELLLADVRNSLHKEVEQVKSAMLENKVLSGLLVKSKDLVNQLRESISCLQKNKDESFLVDSVVTVESGGSVAVPLNSEVDGRLSQTLSESFSSRDSPELRSSSTKEVDCNGSPLTPVFKELRSAVDLIKRDVIKVYNAKTSMEAELSSAKLHWETLCEESNVKIQSSLCQVSRLQDLMQESGEKENKLTTEINDARKCINNLGRDICASNLVRDELIFQVAALKQRNEKLLSTVEEKLAYQLGHERKKRELFDLKKDIDLKYRNILSSRRLVEQRFYDLCNIVQQMMAVYSVDDVEEISQLRLEADGILDVIEDQNTDIHAELLGMILEYVKWSKFDAGVDGERSFLEALYNLPKNDPLPDLKSLIDVFEDSVSSTRNVVQSTCTHLSIDSVDPEDSLELKPSILIPKTGLLEKNVERLVVIQNHSNKLYKALEDTKNVSSSFVAVGNCSQSAIQTRLTHFKHANKRLSDEKNSALKLIRSLKLQLASKTEEERSLREAYLKLLDESDQVRGDLAKTGAILADLENEKLILETELKSLYTGEDLKKKCDLLGGQYEEKLQRMKQKMTTMFKEEMTKIEPVKRENERLEVLCKKYTDKITRYEEYTRKTTSEMNKMKDELESTVMDKTFLQQQVATLNMRLETRSLMETSNASLAQVERRGRYRDHGAQAVTQTRVQRTVNMVDEEDCVTFTCRKSTVHKSFTHGLGQAFSANEDEVGEEFNNTYLADMKAGRVRLPEPDKRRLTELQYRNSMCLPHLKSSYPAETQFNDPREFRDDDLKLGFGIDEGDSSSLSLLLPGERHRKKDRGQTSYQKPGPPTPVKNGGRRSLQAAEALSPRTAGPLRDHNEIVANRSKASTPSRIRALFSSNKIISRRDTENTPVTPRGRRLSIFRK